MFVISCLVWILQAADDSKKLQEDKTEKEKGKSELIEKDEKSKEKESKEKEKDKLKEKDKENEKEKGKDKKKDKEEKENEKEKEKKSKVSRFYWRPELIAGHFHGRLKWDNLFQYTLEFLRRTQDKLYFNNNWTTCIF